MTEAVKLVDQILDEHKQIGEDFKSLEGISGDVEAAARLAGDRVKDDFVPRALDDQGEGLKRWIHQLEVLEKGLRDHFRREETALADAFKLEGTPELVEALNELLSEHGALLRHIEKLRSDANAIASGGRRIEVWEGKGWGMKYNVESLRQEILAHAEREKELFTRLKSRIKRD